MRVKLRPKRNSKDLFRERISDVSIEAPFFHMGHAEISEALMSSAFAWRDFGGGKEDSLYAAKSLHELVDSELARRLQK